MATHVTAGRAAASLVLKVLRGVLGGLAKDGMVSLADIDRAISLIERGTIELDKAYEMAKEAYNSSTNNPFFASTYAYALLLQDRKSEALGVADSVKAEYLKIPSVALYYGVVQAHGGKGPRPRAQCPAADRLRRRR